MACPPPASQPRSGQPRKAVVILLNGLQRLTRRHRDFGGVVMHSCCYGGSLARAEESARGWLPPEVESNCLSEAGHPRMGCQPSCQTTSVLQ